MRTAYKCRVYPTESQAALLSRTFGCVRVVWNHTLNWRHERYHVQGVNTSFLDANAFLTALKKEPEFAWLNEISAVPLQQCLRHQQVAFTSFFQGRSRYPRFKSRSYRQSAEFTRSAFRMKNGDLWLAKTTEPLRFVWSWPDVDVTTLDPSTVTISRDPSGRWFVSFAVEVSDPKPLPLARQSVGIDVGLTDIAVLSTGEKIKHPRHMDQHERRLKRYQKMMARRQKGSNRRAKARKHVAKAHAKVADARRDHLHKMTTTLVRENDVIAVEDLAPSNMIKNRRLSKAISRTGWFEFRRQLEYKTERVGRDFRICNRWYPSSKTCSACGYLLDKLSLGTRHWTCPSCGTRHDRDINAAKNIKVAAGLVETQNARGDDVGRTEVTRTQLSMKRESSSFRAE